MAVLTAPPVVVGPGQITFGTTGDSRYRVVDPKTTFGVDEAMVWSAYLTEPADSTALQIRILRTDPAAPAEPRVVRIDPVSPVANDVQIFFRRLRPIAATAGAGLFTVQYVRGDTVLAQGSFLVQ